MKGEKDEETKRRERRRKTETSNLSEGVRPAEPACPTGGEKRGRQTACDLRSEARGGCDAKPYLAPGSMLRALVSLLPKIFCFKFNLLSKQQHGFVKNKSCTTNLQ